jgi:hypothetical protein
MLYVYAEGSNIQDIRRLLLINHRGQRAGHAYKGRVAEDGRADYFPPEKPGTGQRYNKAGLGMVTIITGLRGTNNMMGQGYLRQGITRVNETNSGSQSL